MNKKLVDTEGTSSISYSFERLLTYCENECYKGFDPYDGLNSSFFQSVAFMRNSRTARLIWIQMFKRMPINLRKIFGIGKEFNPKAGGLFLSGYCNLYRKTGDPKYIDKITFFSEKLLAVISPNWSGACWGYNFDWQARAFFQPKYTPTVVASTFIASALLDAFEITKDEKLLSTARSTCNFILRDLNRTPDDQGNFAFSYSPLDKSVVYNASLLGSKILSRVYSFTWEEELIDAAKKSVEFCCRHQRSDGSWGYGTKDFHQWVDNFHTGYNLECISEYMRYSGDSCYTNHLDKGFDYYVKTFFTLEGVSKYYNNSIYPIDIHAPAQLTATLVKLDKFKEHRDLIDRVLGWTIDNMQAKSGYFYYQINKLFSSKIPYMRWAQAWMFYSLSIYLLAEKIDNDRPELEGEELHVTDQVS